MIARRLSIAVATTFAVACAPAAPTHDLAADTAAINQVRTGYEAALNAGDATQLSTLFAADAHSMQTNQPTATGPAGVEAAIKGMLGQVTPHITITSEKLEVAGDVAYDRGTYKTVMTPKAAGAAPMTEEGRYLVVLRRQADGSWKLVEEMGNLAAAPAPMAKMETKKK